MLGNAGSDGCILPSLFRCLPFTLFALGCVSRLCLLLVIQTHVQLGIALNLLLLEQAHLTRHSIGLLLLSNLQQHLLVAMVRT